MRKLTKILPVSGITAAIAITGSCTPMILAILAAIIGAMWVLARDERTKRLIGVIRAIRCQGDTPEPETCFLPGPRLISKMEKTADTGPHRRLRLRVSVTEVRIRAQNRSAVVCPGLNRGRVRARINGWPYAES